MVSASSGVFNAELLTVDFLELTYAFGIVCRMAVASTQRNIDGLVPSRAAARLRSFRREVDKVLAGNVTDVVLFGSRARGDGRTDSDYDVAVLVRHIDDRRHLDHLLSDIAYPHVLSGVHIRPVSVSSNLLDDPVGSAFASSILRDGIAIPRSEGQ